MKDDIVQRPNRVPWPPILVLGALLAAWGLEALCPSGEVLARTGAWFKMVGVVLACAGVGFDLAAMLTMHRARTNILPHRAAGRLVTGGVFALSRNPIYLGNTLLLLGAALALGCPWLLVTALVAAVLVNQLAIKREERHLAARFGSAFAEYRQHVPRWIGLPRRRQPPEQGPH